MVEDAPFVITEISSTGRKHNRTITAKDNLSRSYVISADTPLFFKHSMTAKDGVTESRPYLLLPAVWLVISSSMV